MSNDVRKLALDFAFRWMVPLQILAALIADYVYLFDYQTSGLMAGGVILALQGSSTNNKVALWRTLPVTRRDVGHARWWQMTGLPGLGIVAIMATALAVHGLMIAMGWDRLPMRFGAMDLLCGLLLQFFYPVFLTLFALAILVARTSRSPFAYAGVVAVWTPWLLLLPQSIPLPAQDRYLLLGLIGVGLAVILYATAARWPQPVTQPVQLDLGRDRNRAGISAPAGHGGWGPLCGIALARVALVLIPVVILYVTAIVALNLRNIVPLQMQLFTSLIVITQISQFNGTALRALRVLPGSALALTGYLVLLPLAMLAATALGYSLLLAPWLTGSAPQVDIVALSAVLFAGALALPAALAVSQTAMSLIVLLSMMVTALIQFGWSYVPQPWNDLRLLAGLTAIAIGTGFLWMHAQISRGVRVYRLQPLIPAHWRGND